MAVAASRYVMSALASSVKAVAKRHFPKRTLQFAVLHTPYTAKICNG